MAEHQSLSPRQAALVASVDRLTRLRGFPPSLRELAADLGVNVARAAALARVAEARGRLVHEPRVPRSWRAIPAPGTPRKPAKKNRSRGHFTSGNVH